MPPALAGPPGSRFHFADFEHYAQFRELVGSLTDFRLEYRKVFPEYGCSLTILRRS